MDHLTRETLDDHEYMRGEIRALAGAVGYLLRRDVEQGGRAKQFLGNAKEVARDKATKDFLAGADEMIARLQRALEP